MPDRCALVEDNAAGLLELGNHRPGRVAGSLDDLDALVNDDLGVGLVIWGDESRQESDVDTEWLAGQLPALPDLLAEALGLWEDEGSNNAQAAGVGHSARHLSVSNMLATVLATIFTWQTGGVIYLHATLNNRDCRR